MRVDEIIGLKQHSANSKLRMLFVLERLSHWLISFSKQIQWILSTVSLLIALMTQTICISETSVNLYKTICPTPQKTAIFISCEISSPYGCKYLDDRLLGYNAMLSRWSGPTFQRCYLNQGDRPDETTRRYTPKGYILHLHTHSLEKLKSPISLLSKSTVKNNSCQCPLMLKK
jgi:hypothetical protein